MTYIKNLFLIFSLFVFLNACATEQALNQPTKKDLTVLKFGTDRDLVLLELGAPVDAFVEDGKKVDLFSITQGYSKGVRMARATGHLTAEIMTLGLWGIVGTPLEQSYNGTILGYKVWYDENNKVEKTEKLIEVDAN